MDDMAKNFNDPQYEINENEVNEFIPLLKKTMKSRRNLVMNC